MDKMGMEIIRDRKRILVQEEASGVKDAAGKDLLTLLIRANLRDRDGGMSDEAVLARQFSSCSTRIDRLMPFQKYLRSSLLGTRPRAPP